VEARFDPFGDSPNLDARSVHDMRRRYYGSKIILDTLDRTPSDIGHVESPFDPFRDCVSIGAR
jgi:hypothetical protein